MQKTRVVIIGAGAISQQWHLPILLGRQDAQVVAVIDKSPSILADIKQAYPDLRCEDALTKIPSGSYDAAIVATPAAFHFDITKSLLENNKHVLVEKPVAFTSPETEALAALAEQNTRVLSVSLYRRLYPSLALLKELIEQKQWGDVESFEFLWGDAYSWSATSLGNMKKALAGGGVLMDLGPHALDWLCFLFGAKIELESYIDDAASGIETDCELKLSFKRGRKKLKGELKLSRTRKLGGDLLVRCQHAVLSLSVGERFEVQVIPNDSQANIQYKCNNPKIEDEQWFETFAREHDDFLTAISNEKEAQLSCESVIPAAKIIDQCYATKIPAEHTWRETQALVLPESYQCKKVLITGASGFLGGRIVEILTERSDLQIVAAVNNPNNATRISRYELDMRMCDLNDAESIKNALQGCDAVIHCAVGTAYGDDDYIYRTTVEGTKNLLSMAADVGVKRFVHISSLAVVDLHQQGKEITEHNSVLSSSDDIYSRSKRDAELAVKQCIDERHLDAVILRPTNIYGPNSPLFKVGAGKQAMENGIAFSEQTANSPSNTVYVDNVVLSILWCLSAKQLPHREYFLNDDDDNSYQAFYHYFTEAFDKPMSIENTAASAQGPKAKNNVLKAVAQDAVGIAKSKELRKFFIKIFKSEYIGKPFRWIVTKAPALENRLRDTKGPVFHQASNTESLPFIEASTPAVVSAQQFRKDFSSYQTVDRKSCLEHTQQWLRFYYHEQ